MPQFITAATCAWETLLLADTDLNCWGRVSRAAHFSIPAMFSTRSRLCHRLAFVSLMHRKIKMAEWSRIKKRAKIKPYVHSSFFPTFVKYQTLKNFWRTLVARNVNGKRDVCKLTEHCEISSSILVSGIIKGQLQQNFGPHKKQSVR